MRRYFVNPFEVNNFGSKNKSKYQSKKVICDGIEFDSRQEANRYKELSLMRRAGIISELELQKPFELIPAQFEEIKTGEVYKIGPKKGQPKTKRVCIENSVVYIADFVYKENGKTVVEDAKGFRTKDYIIKKKLMLYIHGIKVKEV